MIERNKPRGEINLEPKTPPAEIKKLPPKVKKPKVMSVDMIIDRLKRQYHSSTGQWILIKELRIGCGFRSGVDRSIDLWAINCYPSKGHQAISYEIKRSRSDFLVDLKNAHAKHRGARVYADKFFYVAQEGMIQLEELPPWAGLITYGPDRTYLRIMQEGLPYEKPRPTWNFICSILRRADKIV